MVSEEEVDDSELARRVAGGDRRSFEPLVDRYQKVLFNAALRMVGNVEDARDLAQNALLKAYQHIRTYDPKQRFFPWIYRIVINEAIDHLDRRRPSQPLDPSLESPRKNPEEEARSTELGARVQAALLALSPAARQVVVLRHFVGLSYRDMSEVLAIPEKTVKSRLFTARRRLGELLLAVGEGT